jgi:nicotinamide-nucleotide amidase
MPPSNLSQATRPRSMRLLANGHGTAPGLAGEHEGCAVYALPGPPREMKGMFQEHVLPQLPPPEEGRCVLTETVHAFGIGESRAEQLLGDMTARDRRPTVGMTAGAAIITARIRLMGEPQEARRRLEETAARIEQTWAPYCCGRGDVTLPQAVGELLRSARQTLVTAESCTGGWLGKMIVDVPGSSDYYRGGWVTYANEMKTSCLDVPTDLIERCGAVSAPVAEAMARGAIGHGRADWSLAITGVAGPEAGGPGKPAGTVYIALASRRQDEVNFRLRRFAFRGDRAMVRDRSAKAALQMLRFALLGVGDDQPLLWESAGPEPEQVDGL